MGTPSEVASAGRSNSIHRLVDAISKAVTSKVQANAAAALADCDTVLAGVAAELEAERALGEAVAAWRVREYALYPAFLLLGCASFIDLLHAVLPHLPASIAGSPVMLALVARTSPYAAHLVSWSALLGLVTLAQRFLAVAGCVVLLSTVVQCIKWRSRGLHPRTPREVLALRTGAVAVDVARVGVNDCFREFVRESQTPDCEAK